MAVPKRTLKAHSRQAAQAIALLGSLIKQRRLEQKLTAEEVAVRTGISRALVYRIERGDPACSIGAAFEAAVIVGVPLFDDETGRATGERLRNAERQLALLPKAARRSRHPVHDEF
jgi:transcriptional regulator with XRE-family HTH domain